VERTSRSPPLGTARRERRHRPSDALVAADHEPGDTEADFLRRLGKSMSELGGTANTDGCPDIWEMENGDIAVVGRDVTASYADRLPDDLTIRADERLVMIPRHLLAAAKPDIPDA
jgi:hypothetical protein